MPNVEGDRERLKEALARHDTLAPEARAAFLAALHRSDPHLARELDSLLAHPTRPELKGGAAGLVADA
ncbi:MAG TPA: 4-(cytidine 5'-diphospho)-2-C-methyl-D-erythritol kinase, partial [Candidatus Eisenbacteria bacterium]